MPAAFAGRRLLLLLLLLLLLCTSLSGGSPAAMTTQDSTQTEVNSLTTTQAGFTESPGPDIATEGLKPASKQVSQYEIVISHVSHTQLERSVFLPSATKVELICKLGEHSPLKNPQVTWKKGSETISHTTKTSNSWSIEVTVSDSSQLGDYICILKAHVEVTATFHLEVPNVEGKEKNKPVIVYEADKAVMVCKTEFTPATWNWYRANGTQLVRIDASSGKERFQIKKQPPHGTRLSISTITKKESGVYWCEASFPLGNRKVRFELRVLSIMEPLKPFLAAVAEVVILVTTIFLYEAYSKKNGHGGEGEREFHQIEQIKTEEEVSGQQ